jgi:TP901 family phage tail tape measure protein
MMPDRIEQTFAIDASQALAALGQLDSGYASLQARLDAVAASMSSFNRRATNSNNGLTNAAANANTYNTALNQLANQGLSNVNTAAQNVNSTLGTFGRNSTQALGGANRAAGEFTVSWETLSRVVQTQLIVRAMSAIRDAISEAVTEAIQFQRQVALIGTIAPDASFNQIAAGVRNVSDSFNLPLLETAKGVYQAISNQVGDFGESLRFTEEAAKFAKATNSSLADSVDLLSGALRSYGLSVEDTGRVSGIFFTAIDKGRVTAEQLANSFGRVGPSAQEIGISLEELAAGVATISDKGIATSETLTQFRGIITSLTKPTDAMKEKLRLLGFSSSQAAIQTLGLDGVLDALSKSTKGSTESLAKLFPNVRGIGGALSLTGENLSTFAENLREAQQNGEDFANSKFLEATNTDAERLTKAVNQVSNAFTIELGQALLKTGADFFSVQGRTESLVAVVESLGHIIPTLIPGVAGLTFGLGALGIQALAVANPVGALVTTIGSLAIAVPAALQAIDDARTRTAFAGFKKLQEANEAELQSFRKAGNDKLRSEKESDDAIVKAAFARIAKINAAYLQDVENAKSSNKALVTDTEKSLDKIISARSKFASELNTAINDSRKAILDSNNRIFELQSKQSDRKFESNTRNLSDAQQVFALTQRAASTARLAEEDLRKAFATGDENLKQRALSQFSKAENLGEQARQIGQRAGSRALEAKAAKELNDISNRQINAEQSINNLQGDRQKKLAKERDEQEKIVEEIRKQQKIVLDNTGFFDKEGKQFSAEDQAKRAKLQQDALKEIGKLAFSAKDFKAADALGLGQFVQSIQNDLHNRPIKLEFDVLSNIAKVKAEIQKSLSNIDVKLPFVKQLEQVSGKDLHNGASPDQINQTVSQLATEAQAIRKNVQDQANLDQEIVKKRAEIQELIGNLEKRLPNAPEGPAKEAVKGTIEQLRSLASESSIDIGKVNEAIAKLKTVDFGGKFGSMATDAKIIQAAFQQAGTLADKLQQKQDANPVDLKRLQEIQGVLSAIGIDNLVTGAGDAVTKIASSVEPIGTIEDSAFNTAGYYERAATAIAAIATTTFPAVPAQAGTTAQFGKMDFRAFGGQPRGMDTIPVMARAGESIITPQATRRFFSQIQAMNAGQQPVFRQDGGTVNNTTGDITINVHGAGSPTKVGRAVMREFLREKRRGTGRA